MHSNHLLFENSRDQHCVQIHLSVQKRLLSIFFRENLSSHIKGLMLGEGDKVYLACLAGILIVMLY